MDGKKPRKTTRADFMNIPSIRSLRVPLKDYILDLMMCFYSLEILINF